MAARGAQVPVMGEENDREITRDKVKIALNKTKGGKAPGMDGVRAEMLKKEGVTALEWLARVLNVVNGNSGLGNCMHGAIIKR